MTVVSGATNLNQVMAQLSLQSASFDILRGDPSGALINLQNAFQALAPNLAGVTGADIPQAGMMPSPATMLSIMGPISGSGYAGVDLAPGTSTDMIDGLMDPARRDAALFERLLKRNPLVRSAFEGMVGGTVILDNNTDGRLTIQRNTQAMAAAGLAQNPLANTAMGLFDQMNAAILNQTRGVAAAEQGVAGPAGGAGGVEINPFLPMIAQGLATVAGGIENFGLGVTPDFTFGSLNGAGSGSNNSLVAPGCI
jgi:hypothetical protein